MDKEEKAKYTELCDFVLEQSKPEGGVGVVLIVVEEHPGADVESQRLRAHVAVQIDTQVKEQLPEILTDLANRLESETRIERFHDLVAALGKEARDDALE